MCEKATHDQARTYGFRAHLECARTVISYYICMPYQHEHTNRLLQTIQSEYDLHSISCHEQRHRNPRRTPAIQRHTTNLVWTLTRPDPRQTRREPRPQTSRPDWTKILIVRGAKGRLPIPIINVIIFEHRLRPSSTGFSAQCTTLWGYMQHESTPR